MYFLFAQNDVSQRQNQSTCFCFSHYLDTLTKCPVILVMAAVIPQVNINDKQTSNTNNNSKSNSNSNSNANFNNNNNKTLKKCTETAFVDMSKIDNGKTTDPNTNINTNTNTNTNTNKNVNLVTNDMNTNKKRNESNSNLDNSMKTSETKNDDMTDQETEITPQSMGSPPLQGRNNSRNGTPNVDCNSDNSTHGSPNPMCQVVSEVVTPRVTGVTPSQTPVTCRSETSSFFPGVNSGNSTLRSDVDNADFVTEFPPISEDDNGNANENENDENESSNNNNNKNKNKNKNGNNIDNNNNSNNNNIDSNKNKNNTQTENEETTKALEEKQEKQQARQQQEKQKKKKPKATRADNESVREHYKYAQKRDIEKVLRENHPQLIEKRDSIYKLARDNDINESSPVTDRLYYIGQVVKFCFFNIEPPNEYTAVQLYIFVVMACACV